MEKYMKFTMFKKETTDKKYHENPYRTVNFKRDGSGNLICPNGRKFHFKSRQNVYKNKYGRTEEIYECESCRTPVASTFTNIIIKSREKVWLRKMIFFAHMV